MYAAVEFPDKEIAVVPMSWVIGASQCYWPNIKSNEALIRLVKNLTPPKKWPIYTLKKILFTHENYDIAEERCNKIISESESSSNNGNSNSLVFKGITVDKDMPSSTDSYSEDSFSEDDLIKSIGSRKRKHRPEVNVSKKTKLSTNQLFLDASTSTPRSTRAESMIQNNILTSAAMDRTIDINEDRNNGEMLKKIFTALQQIKNNVDQNTIKIDQLYYDMVKKNKNLVINHTVPENFPNLPLTKGDGLIILETFLGDKNNFSYLIHRLSVVGGTDVRSTTMNILKFLLSDQLASQYNWEGRDRAHTADAERKLAFKNTKVMEAIYDSVKLAYANNSQRSDLSDKDIAAAVKSWLKLAPQRSKKK